MSVFNPLTVKGAGLTCQGRLTKYWTVQNDRNAPDSAGVQKSKSRWAGPWSLSHPRAGTSLPLAASGVGRVRSFWGLPGTISSGPGDNLFWASLVASGNSWKSLPRLGMHHCNLCPAFTGVILPCGLTVSSLHLSVSKPSPSYEDTSPPASESYLLQKDRVLTDPVCNHPSLSKVTLWSARA